MLARGLHTGLGYGNPTERPNIDRCSPYFMAGSQADRPLESEGSQAEDTWGEPSTLVQGAIAMSRP